RRAAHVAERPEGLEVELPREGLEVEAREAGHRAQELLEARLLGVELLEHALAAVLDLVLRLAGAQRGGEVVPEAEQARVEHLEDGADVARARAVEKEAPRGRVAVARGGPGAVALEEAQRHQRVEEVRDGARVQPELAAQLLAREAPRAEPREDAELDGGEQDLGGPEAEGGLDDGGDVGGLGHPADVPVPRAAAQAGPSLTRSRGW